MLVLEVPAGTPADKAGFKGTYRCVISAALGCTSINKVSEAGCTK